MEEEAGYREARRLLQDRYGQGYRIATAYVDRLSKIAPIKAEDSFAELLYHACELQEHFERGYMQK